MGKPTGFIEIQRKKHPTRPVDERVHDWREVYLPSPTGDLMEQGARCMDCGIPFCHQGCPLGNLIPDWNDLVYHDRWQTAIERLPPAVAVDEIVPVGNQVAQRTPVMAERNAAIHAARCLILQRRFLVRERHLAPVP